MLEDLAEHPFRIAHPFAHDGRAADAVKIGIGLIGNNAGKVGFPGARRTCKQDSLHGARANSLELIMAFQLRIDKLFCSRNDMLVTTKIIERKPPPPPALPETMMRKFRHRLNLAVLGLAHPIVSAEYLTTVYFDGAIRRDGDFLGIAQPQHGVA